MIKDAYTNLTLDLVEQEAIANEPKAIDTAAMIEANGEDWKNCEAYKNFRPNSSLPFCCFFDGSTLIKSGHYSIETLTTKDGSTGAPIQRFYKQYPNGSILVYDPSAPFGITEYELI